MDKALGKPDISEEEATPLVIDDSDDGSPQKWVLAGKINKTTTIVQIDPVGGFLRTRVSINVQKPLRRWILIDSAKRKSTEKTRDENGDLPFKLGLHASDDHRRMNSGENQPKSNNQNSTTESRSSSSKQKDGVEVTSPAKTPVQNKRKEGPQSNQVYRLVAKLSLAITEHGEAMACREAAMDLVFQGAASVEDPTDVITERSKEKEAYTTFL
ncbi:hypothetical protein D1007_25414 [Hordeum vulgare]|nr:hypothetical protein D1007_25414 [Hordeum vulgare]